MGKCLDSKTSDNHTSTPLIKINLPLDITGSTIASLAGILSNLLPAGAADGKSYLFV